VPLAVGLMACIAVFLERNDWTSCIPVPFIGAGAFFAFMNYTPGAMFGNAAFTTMVYYLIGLVFGCVTILLRSQHKRKKSKNRTIIN
jgi:hypothetical protein